MMKTIGEKEREKEEKEGEQKERISVLGCKKEGGRETFKESIVKF